MAVRISRSGTNVFPENRGNNQNQLISDCSTHPFLSVVVCTTGTRPSLHDCLTSLAAQQCRHYEILVVLNRSLEPEFTEQLAQYPVRVLTEPRKGVCAARNRAIPEADGDILCFVDDDVVAEPDWLHHMAAGFSDPQVACVTGRVILRGAFLPRETIERSYESKRALSSWSLDRSDPNWYATVLGPDVGFGCNMGFKKSFLEHHTVFPEELGAGAVIGATDEAFMFVQVLKNGLRIHHTPEAVVTHLYENDPIKQKIRAAEVCSALVAFHVRFLLEESGFRFATLKLLARAFARRLRRVLRGQEMFRKKNEGLSLAERYRADFRGLLVYYKYRRVKRLRYPLSTARAASAEVPCRNPEP